MKHKLHNRLLIFCVFLVVTVVFFHPLFFKGLIPFPGDLLLAQYQPWRSSSYAGLNAGAVPNKAQYFDTLRQLYPWKTFAIGDFLEGSLPLWNPHNFSGSPLFANFQSALLFPLNFFYLLFSQVTAWSVIVTLQPFLCMVFAYLLARKYGLSRIASVFSSSSYAFCLYMTTFLEYNIMGHFMYLVPLAMLSVEWIIENKKLSFLLLSGVVAISAFAGHAQLFGGTVFYILAYGAVRSLQSKKSFRSGIMSWFILAFFVLTGIGIAAVQLVPGLELLSESARSSHPPSYFYNNLLIRPSQLVLYLVPDLFGNPATRNYLVPFSYPSKALYVGIPALLFALISIFIRPKSNYYFATGAVTMLIAAFVFLNPLSFLLYGFNLPFISTSSPSNLIFLVSLGLCLLAGFGVDQIMRGLPRSFYLAICSLWVALAGIFVVTQILHIAVIRNSIIFSSIILFLITAAVILTRIMRWSGVVLALCVVVISCFDLFYFFHKFNPFVPVGFVYPQTPISNWLKSNTGINRVWGYSYAGIEANFATQLGIYSPDGYDPLYPKRYGELIQTAVDGQIPKAFTDRTRSDAVIVGGFGEKNMVENTYRLKLLSILGVKFILDKVENGSSIKTFPPALFKKAAAVDDFNVFLYRSAAPRFFLTNSYHTFSTKEQFTDAFFDSSFDPSHDILLEESPAIDLSQKLSRKHTKLLSYVQSSAKIKTDSDAPALLYLSDTYYPGWKAYVDEKVTPILRANYAFRSVVVPAGIHTVHFRYEPDSLRNGLYLSTFSIMVTIGSWGFIRWRIKNDHKKK